MKNLRGGGGLNLHSSSFLEGEGARRRHAVRALGAARNVDRRVRGDGAVGRRRLDLDVHEMARARRAEGLQDFLAAWPP